MWGTPASLISSLFFEEKCSSFFFSTLHCNLKIIFKFSSSGKAATRLFGSNCQMTNKRKNVLSQCICDSALIICFCVYPHRCLHSCRPDRNLIEHLHISQAQLGCPERPKQLIHQFCVFVLFCKQSSNLQHNEQGTNNHRTFTWY